MWRWRQSLERCAYKPRNAKEHLEPAVAGCIKLWITRSWLCPRDFREHKALPWCWEPWFWTSRSQNCERIHFWWFKPPTLWKFITAAQETNTSTLRELCKRLEEPGHPVGRSGGAPRPHRQMWDSSQALAENFSAKPILFWLQAILLQQALPIKTSQSHNVYLYLSVSSARFWTYKG